jgi:hypothetical protein
MGADFNRPIVARGAAYADIDHDGDLDILITSNNGPAYLFRNDGREQEQVSERARGRDEVESQRDRRGDAIESASGKQWNVVRSGSSYCSQSDLAVTFGLGADAAVTALEIEWPSGTNSDSPKSRRTSSLLSTRRRESSRNQPGRAAPIMAAGRPFRRLDPQRVRGMQSRPTLSSPPAQARQRIQIRIAAHELAI